MRNFRIIFSGFVTAALVFGFVLSASAAPGSFHRYQSQSQYPSNYKYWQQFFQPQQPAPQQPAPEQPAPQQPAPQQPAPEQPAPQQPVPQQPAPEQPAPQQPAPQQPAPEQPAPQQPPVDSPGTSGLTADEQQMVNLVNAERSKNGLAPLTVNAKLTEMARVKAKDMIDNNYFNHNSPTYGSPFDMMKQFGISYRTAGENIAGNSSVTAAHQALMNSSGHRANILSSNFKEIGIGIVDGGPYGKMFVQEFIG